MKPSDVLDILPLDCEAILLALARKDVCNADVAMILNVPRSTVQGWKVGRMPVEPNGRRLAALFSLYYPNAEIPSCVPKESSEVL